MWKAELYRIYWEDAEDKYKCESTPYLTLDSSNIIDFDLTMNIGGNDVVRIKFYDSSLDLSSFQVGDRIVVSDDYGNIIWGGLLFKWSNKDGVWSITGYDLLYRLKNKNLGIYKIVSSYMLGDIIEDMVRYVDKDDDGNIIVAECNQIITDFVLNIYSTSSADYSRRNVYNALNELISKYGLLMYVKPYHTKRWNDDAGTWESVTISNVLHLSYAGYSPLFLDDFKYYYIDTRMFQWHRDDVTHWSESDSYIESQGDGYYITTEVSQSYKLNIRYLFRIWWSGHYEIYPRYKSADTYLLIDAYKDKVDGTNYIVVKHVVDSTATTVLTISDSDLDMSQLDGWITLLLDLTPMDTNTFKVTLKVLDERGYPLVTKSDDNSGSGYNNIATDTIEIKDVTGTVRIDGVYVYEASLADNDYLTDDEIVELNKGYNYSQYKNKIKILYSNPIIMEDFTSTAINPKLKLYYGGTRLYSYPSGWIHTGDEGYLRFTDRSNEVKFETMDYYFGGEVRLRLATMTWGSGDYIRILFSNNNYRWNIYYAGEASPPECIPSITPLWISFEYWDADSSSWVSKAMAVGLCTGQQLNYFDLILKIDYPNVEARVETNAERIKVFEGLKLNTDDSGNYYLEPSPISISFLGDYQIDKIYVSSGLRDEVIRSSSDNIGSIGLFELVIKTAGEGYELVNDILDEILNVKKESVKETTVKVYENNGTRFELGGLLGIDSDTFNYYSIDMISSIRYVYSEEDNYMLISLRRILGIEDIIYALFHEAQWAEEIEKYGRRRDLPSDIDKTWKVVSGGWYIG